MKVLGIYGSPRKGGNTDQLLDKALEGARSTGAEIATVYARKLEMSGCIECGGCDKTGKCVVKDDMQTVYPILEEADVIIPVNKNWLQKTKKGSYIIFKDSRDKKCKIHIDEKEDKPDADKAKLKGIKVVGKIDLDKPNSKAKKKQK